MAWTELASLTASMDWQFTLPASFELCRIQTIPIGWGRGLIAQVSPSEPHDFYQVKRLYGSESQIIKMVRPECFDEVQAIAIKQYQGYFWQLLIEIWQ